MNNDEPVDSKIEDELPKGNGSVAHQIIGEFLNAVEENKELSDVAKRLREDIFLGKPTEATLRFALFGESEL